MNSLRKQISFALAATLAPSVALGQVTYGTDDISASDNYVLNISTGVSTGPEWTGADAWGIADDDTVSINYVNDGANLFTVPFNNGGAAATALGTIVAPGTTTTQSMTGLAFRNGTLYGHRNIAVEALYTIDLVTLEATPVLVYSATAIDLGGLDVDPATGIIFASNDSATYAAPNGPAGRGIIALNVATGTETNLYPYPTIASGAELNDGDGLAFDPTGAGFIYVIEDNPAPLHRYDIGAGAYDPNPPISAVPASEVFSAGTYTGASAGGSIGTSFCAANPNSTGVAGEISATGSTAAADNNVTLTAAQLPVGQFGIFVTSTTATAGTPVGSGVLCLTGQLGRYNLPGQILQVDAAGEFSLALDLTQTPLPAAFTSVMAGETRSWQAWHRDFTGGGASTSNFTNGVTITFN